MTRTRSRCANHSRLDTTRIETQNTNTSTSPHKRDTNPRAGQPRPNNTHKRTCRKPTRKTSHTRQSFRAHITTQATTRLASGSQKMFSVLFHQRDTIHPTNDTRPQSTLPATLPRSQADKHREYTSERQQSLPTNPSRRAQSSTANELQSSSIRTQHDKGPSRPPDTRTPRPTEHQNDSEHTRCPEVGLGRIDQDPNSTSGHPNPTSKRTSKRLGANSDQTKKRSD